MEGNCLLCKKKISPKDKDYCISSSDWILCIECSRWRMEEIVKHIEDFRKKIDFYDITSLKKESRLVIDKMGDFADFDEIASAKDAQIALISNQISYVETLIERYGKLTLRPLREELLTLFDKMTEE